MNSEDTWFYSGIKKTWEKQILTDAYPGLEAHVRGGVTCKHNHTFFFKSNNLKILN